jgi:hypothetical protein
MIPGGFRKEIVPAGFSAEAQSKVVMAEKAEFSATVCTAVVQLDHGIPVWSLVRRGDSRRAAIDFAHLSYKWGTAHCREISAELIFRNPAFTTSSPWFASRYRRGGFVFQICGFSVVGSFSQTVSF